MSVLKILVSPTHPGLVASPVSLCSLHILNSHIYISSEPTSGSLQSPHQYAVMFLAMPLPLEVISHHSGDRHMRASSSQHTFPSLLRGPWRGQGMHLGFICLFSKVT